MNDLIQLRPFMFNAYREWIIASGFKPFVSITYDDKVMPLFLKKYVNPNGEIHFNLCPHAIAYFQIDEGGLSFSARFNGKAEDIFIPLDNLVSIYASGTGIEFVMTSILEPHMFHPYFQKIKKEIQENETKKTASLTQQLKLTSALTDASRYNGSDDTSPTKPTGNKPTLRVIK